MNCVVRFAPSPTGYMHIGNARIAIVNFLFAKKNTGKFILRIDDTDIARSRKEYEDAIIRDLQWLGISYDEFFRQSERIDRYKQIQKKLIEDGSLYECFESQDELDYKRKTAIARGKPPVYDRASLKLSNDEKNRLRSEGVQSYWRFLLPNKTISWHDIVLGDISYDLSNVSDPVVVKADGTFLYTFSSVIDDIDSKITNIIRGQDHLTNTAVQIAMFDHISNEETHIDFAHLSLLVNKDGSQFSKRLGSLNLEEIKNQGVDPMAISSLMASLGTANDIIPFTNIDDLARHFDISKFTANSPKFDIDDIIKINKKILHLKTYDEIKSMIGDEHCPSKEVFDIVRENVESLKDYAVWKDVFSGEFCANGVFSDDEVDILKAAKLVLESSNHSAQSFVDGVKLEANVSGKRLFMPIRRAITSFDHGPNLNSVIEILGMEEVLRRIKMAIDHS